MTREKNTWRDFMLSNTKDMRREYDLEYTFNKNMFYLFQIASGIWKYNGIEEDNKRFPVELERRLFFNGVAGIVKHNGRCAAVTAEPYGRDIYGLPTEYNFTFRNGETPNDYNREIGVSGVLGINSYLYIPTYYFAYDYAAKLAHIDLSIVCDTVNQRAQDVFIAANDSGKESANGFYNSLYNGRPSAIKNAANISFTHETRDRKNTGTLRELMDGRKTVLAEFYGLMGIKRLPDKKERLITEEVKNDANLMQLNIAEMFECRKQMIADCNAIFSTNYSVECIADVDGDGTPEDKERTANNETTTESL